MKPTDITPIVKQVQAMSFPVIRREDAITMVGPGWTPLVLACYEICDATNLRFAVDTVKEKFGGLRFYLTFLEWETLSEEHRAKAERALTAISYQEGLSYQTCEECGESGSAEPGGPSGGWIKTHCAQHKAEWAARRRT